ncbi:MAG: J domain-containing protein [Candidatus Methylacidiphilales bacterium]
MNSEPKNHYQILGVSHTASPGQIRRVFVAKAEQFRSEPEGEYDCTLAELNNAFIVLSDAEQRKAYDLTLQGSDKVQAPPELKLNLVHLLLLVGVLGLFLGGTFLYNRLTASPEDLLTSEERAALNKKLAEEREKFISEKTYTRTESGIVSSPGDWNGDGSIKINNGNSYDAIVTLTRGTKDVYTCFVTRNSTFTISGIPKGFYYLTFSLGTQLYKDKMEFFDRHESTGFMEPFKFPGEKNDVAIANTNYYVTLHKIAHGNAKTHTQY